MSEETLTLPPGCGCKSNIVPELASMGVSVMLAGNMGDGAINLMASHGIETIRGCAGDLREVVHAWLAGQVNDSAFVCQSRDSGGCAEHS